METRIWIPQVIQYTGGKQRYTGAPNRDYDNFTPSTRVSKTKGCVGNETLERINSQYIREDVLNFLILAENGPFD